jgi:hypothetical protein
MQMYTIPIGFEFTSMPGAQAIQTSIAATQP